MLYHSSRHAAEQESPDRAEAFGAGHNEVGFVRFGGFQNFVGGIPDRRHLLDHIAGSQQFA